MKIATIILLLLIAGCATQEKNTITIELPKVEYEPCTT